MMTSNSAAADSTGEFAAVSDEELRPAVVAERMARAEIALERGLLVPPTARAVERVVDSPETPALLESEAGSDSERPTSGTRLSRAALAARVESAMAASERTESALADLLRTAKFLSASITTVRGANAELVRELEVLCAVVDGDGAERMALERRIHRLERVVEETGREAHHDREFLVSEHDAFIATLIDDHERELHALRRRLAETLENSQASSLPLPRSSD